ncbi:MAG TPA: FAD-dependent oxidoreductase [Candidatus Dormibacteraeota bacterium]|nr:FAD-dependent oxidoreductase [Candidatus Dormibacteraeota bacterium]
MNSTRRPHVVVLGGGFGGLEAAFLLRMRVGDKADVTLLTDQPDFLFKPNTIYIPFGLDPAELTIDLRRPAERAGVELHVERVEGVDPRAGTVQTTGRLVPYDHLVVATGASMRPAEVPGLAEHANTIWTPAEMLRLRASLGALVEAAREGTQRRVLFLIPPQNKCAGPLYEIAMMLDTWLRRRGVRDAVDITWTTYERGYIQAFGPRLHEVVSAEFARRGILGMTGMVVSEVVGHEVRYAGGATLPFDLLVSFPPYVAAAPQPLLPVDDRGFVATDQATRRVPGHPEVYAVGDAADFPVKQAFLALLQADTAAELIAAQVLHTVPQAAFDPTSMCVMEQFDKATFAQVPLQLTGDAGLPVEVRPDALASYRVGSSPAWRLGKRLLGMYLPWRFRAGRPFHAGLPWRGMEAGLAIMSRVMAA